MSNNEKETFNNFTENLLNCSFCHSLESESLIVKTKNGKYACEECFDPVDPEQRGEEEITFNNNVEIGENEVNSSSFKFTNTFTSNGEKSHEKAIEINAEELNKGVEIPKELNIIDCPPDKNPDKE
jgi:hypothetical protein